ncbi:MAG: homocysteine S-methyltransferase [Cellulomonas sp.]
MTTDLAQAIARGPVPIDGGLSNELERAGADLSGDLWSARLLRDDPEAIVAAHATYFDAGARVAITASYQTSFEGFAAHGVGPDEAIALMRRSVTLARAAAERRGLAEEAWVAASVGPYGALLAGGEEYTGAYATPGWTGRTQGGLTVAELRAFHRPRIDALLAASPDLLALETIPAAAEAEALLLEVADVGVPAWLALTTVTAPDGSVRTRLGEDAAEVFAMAADVDAIIAVGLNCTDPAGAAAAVRVAAQASGKPVVVYPNSGGTWLAAERRWAGSPSFSPEVIESWVDLGARLVGGCCQVGRAEIAEITAVLAGMGLRHGVRVLECGPGTPLAGKGDCEGLIGDAFGAHAEVVVIPVDRLDPRFFDLSTGVAGEVLQTLVNYRLRVVILGRVPGRAPSAALQDFMRESNRGRQVWFVADLAELDARLAPAGA